MSRPVSMEEIRQLSVAERVLLVEEIWDTICDEDESWALSDEQRRELENRVAAQRENPQAGSTWDEVKAGLRTSLARS